MTVWQEQPEFKMVKNVSDFKNLQAFSVFKKQSGTNPLRSGTGQTGVAGKKEAVCVCEFVFMGEC